MVVATSAAAGTRPELLQLAVALPAASLLAAICLRFNRFSIILLIVWLTLFGTLRSSSTDRAALGRRATAFSVEHMSVVGAADAFVNLLTDR